MIADAIKTYYQTCPGIGRDFTTAPEVSQVFGELIALVLMDIYHQLGSPAAIALTELGPGRGTLMADILRVARLDAAFSQALRLYLVEISPILRTQQRKAIKHPAVWVANIEDIPLDMPQLIIANEFLDTMVGEEEAKKMGTLREVNVPTSFIGQVKGRVKKKNGIFLCFDYGYENGEGDTLQALYRGNPVDPFSYLGKADISCHVNFGKLKADCADMPTWGPLPQGQFLKNLHIRERIDRLKAANPTERAALEAAYQRLTHPLQMGVLFKAFALTFPHTLVPLGFDDEAV